MGFSKADERFMRLCLSLAKNGEGRVSPNPLVGAVVVRGGRIIGEGFHERFGGPHAEVNALRGIDARGATLYVSLEPCSHGGGTKKTPPCSPLVISSGVSRVVIATEDPNPRVSGRGISQLRKAGLQVESGLLSREAQEQNEAFFRFMKTGRPFVLAKLAQSANGKIGIAGKSRVWLSGKKFDAYCHLLRNRCDSILVGINTVLADDPRLTCRMQGGRNPARIILDSHLRIPLSARVLRNAKKDRVIIAASESHDGKKAEKLLEMGAEIFVCGKESASLPSLLCELPNQGIYSVLIEGGAKTVASALKTKVVDKAVVAVSRKKITEQDAISSPFSIPLMKRKLLRLKVEKIGSDTVYSGYLRQPSS